MARKVIITYVHVRRKLLVKYCLRQNLVYHKTYNRDSIIANLMYGSLFIGKNTPRKEKTRALRKNVVCVETLAYTSMLFIYRYKI